ncbi:MAG: argininosuccinate synthase [Candidatus Tritonobacter lacicola]|nr:argininosuccinate synthase [Candidatus Tritonobacter lacicola]
MSKVVLAYSGGLDTSIILKWLIEEKGLEVIAFIADLGQGEEVGPIEEKAEKTGASKVYVADLREEFVSDFIFPVIKACAIYEGYYLLGTSVARPLIAKKQVEIAKKENAGYLSHGATGKGNDQVRFEITYFHFMPDAKVIAPWREWDLSSRTDLFAYAKKHGIEVPGSVEKPYSSDRNIMHISYEGGILEDPWREPDEEIFTLSVSPKDAPDEETYIEIDFESGIPVAIDGRNMGPVEMLGSLNDIGGRNGIGRVDMVEDRYVGMKCRGIYETPGGTILHHAHRAVESLTLDREVMKLRDSLVPRYASLVYNGFWYAPEMELLRSMTDEIQKNVTGTARLKLYKGNCTVVGRKSASSLYHPEFATFEKDSVYRQSDATGFIKLNALRLRIQSILKQREKEDG